MKNLSEKLATLGFVAGVDFRARDDGGGPYIAEWLSKSPRPKDADIEAVTLGAATYRLYKSVLIRRLTEAEATTLKAVLNAAPDKSQMLWAASEWLDSADPLFLTLKAAIAQALGAKRAGEILAAE